MYPLIAQSYNAFSPFVLVFVRMLDSYLQLLHLTELSSPTLPTELQHSR
jgi:hypothetical protein